MRVERADFVSGALDLGTADIRRRVNDLALQIRQRHHVVVDDAERTHARGRQIHQRRRAETPGSDHQHARIAQRVLAGAADFAHHDVAGIAFKFVGAQHRPAVLVSIQRRTRARTSVAAVTDQADVFQ